MLACDLLTEDQAVDRLMYQNTYDLRETVYWAYKDFYGYRPSHLTTMKHAELVSWILFHYKWDVQNQRWNNKVPFVGE